MSGRRFRGHTPLPPMPAPPHVEIETTVDESGTRTEWVYAAGDGRRELITKRTIAPADTNVTHSTASRNRWAPGNSD